MRLPSLLGLCTAWCHGALGEVIPLSWSEPLLSEIFTLHLYTLCLPQTWPVDLLSHMACCGTTDIHGHLALPVPLVTRGLRLVGNLHF